MTDPWSRKPPDEEAKNKSRPLWLWATAAGAALFALIVYLINRYPEVAAGEEAKMRLTYSVLLLALVGGSLLMHRRTRPGQVLRQAAAWAGIGAVLFLGYAFRHQGVALWNRLAGELVPGRGVVDGGAITFSADASGHFVAEVEVEGVAIRMLVDTGASVVVLSPADARRLGFDMEALKFDQVFSTANGQVRGAPVRLRRMVLGPIHLTDVRASVNGAPMSGSLLGMSFLSRLSSYEVSGDRLTLRP